MLVNFVVLVLVNFVRVRARRNAAAGVRVVSYVRSTIAVAEAG